MFETPCPSRKSEVSTEPSAQRSLVQREPQKHDSTPEGVRPAMQAACKLLKNKLDKPLRDALPNNMPL